MNVTAADINAYLTFSKEHDQLSDIKTDADRAKVVKFVNARIEGEGAKSERAGTTTNLAEVGNLVHDLAEAESNRGIAALATAGRREGSANEGNVQRLAGTGYSVENPFLQRSVSAGEGRTAPVGDWLRGLEPASIRLDDRLLPNLPKGCFGAIGMTLPGEAGQGPTDDGYVVRLYGSQDKPSATIEARMGGEQSQELPLSGSAGRTVVQHARIAAEAEMATWGARADSAQTLSNKIGELRAQGKNDKEITTELSAQGFDDMEIVAARGNPAAFAQSMREMQENAEVRLRSSLDTITRAVGGRTEVDPATGGTPGSVSATSVAYQGAGALHVDPSLHTKAVVWAAGTDEPILTGSFNLDPRGLRHNSEAEPLIGGRSINASWVRSLDAQQVRLGEMNLPSSAKDCFAAATLGIPNATGAIDQNNSYAVRLYGSPETPRATIQISTGGSTSEEAPLRGALGQAVLKQATVAAQSELERSGAARDTAERLVTRLGELKGQGMGSKEISAVLATEGFDLMEVVAAKGRPTDYMHSAQSMHESIERRVNTELGALKKAVDDQNAITPNGAG